MGGIGQGRVGGDRGGPGRGSVILGDIVVVKCRKT